MTTRAVILGGGGVAGIAWETGILHGLIGRGVDLGSADVVIGTSAGSFVGSYLAAGTVPSWFDRQRAGGADEIAAAWSEHWLDEVHVAIEAGAGDPALTCQALGAMASRRGEVSTVERAEVVRSRVDSHDWPSERLKVTAIDADDGTLHVLDSGSGIAFLDAVSASGAVPGVWPVVSAGGRRWIDGACLSANNAHLGAGYDVVTIVALRPDGLVPEASNLAAEVEELRALGSHVDVILPNDRSVEVLGDNPFDPSVRAAAAEAGRLQGLELADDFSVNWLDSDALREG